MPLDPLFAAFVAVEDNVEELAAKAAELTEPAVLSTATKVADAVARQTANAIATAIVAKAGTDALQAATTVSERLTAERLPGEVSSYLQANPPAKGETGDSIKGDAGLTWRGPYKRGTVYQTDDVVSFEGSSYIATRPTRATPPGGAWQLLARKGKDGKDGTTPMWVGGGSGSGGGGGAVSSVNGQVGVVVLTASDVSALGATAAAGGDLSGNYPNPSVVDDSHSHTAATLPAAVAATTYLSIVKWGVR